MLSKEVKESELEQYIQKAKLSTTDLKNNKEQKKENKLFNYMSQVKDIAIGEFMR